MTTSKLSLDDVKKLTSDPSGEHRIEAATKIASQFSAETLSGAERALAEEIFRLMMQDAEVRVRESLATNLKESSQVPHDVALSLANDVESVSLPMLQYSDVLSDDDLIEILRSQDAGGGVQKQMAIAQRDGVSETVSDALVDRGDESVIGALVQNQSAEISENTFQRVIEDHGRSNAIQEAMVNRPKLPLAISERLVSVVSDQLKNRLVENQNLGSDMATDLLLQSRERATILLTEDSSEEELCRMIHAMRLHGRLTPSIVLRALCMGDINFYEAALAELAALPLVNARKLIHDPGRLGLKGIYEKALLPGPHYPAHAAALAVSDDMEYDGEEMDRERYSRRMIERILTQYGDLGVEFDSDDLNYLLSKMEKLPSDVVGVAEKNMLEGE